MPDTPAQAERLGKLCERSPRQAGDQALDAAEKDGGPPKECYAKIYLRCLLGQRLVVTINDGRKFEGTLSCIDSDTNLFLKDCYEHYGEVLLNGREAAKLTPKDYEDLLNEANSEEVRWSGKRRFVGQVLIPGGKIRRTEILEEVKEKVEKRAKTRFGWQLEDNDSSRQVSGPLSALRNKLQGSQGSASALAEAADKVNSEALGKSCGSEGENLTAPIPEDPEAEARAEAEVEVNL